jgi:hypothetical protein
MANGSSREVEGTEALVHSLARVLGDEVARNTVRDAISQLGFAGRALGRREQVQLFEWLAQRPGLVGVAARRAQGSIVLASSGPEPAPRVVSMSAPRPVRPGPSGDAIGGAELVSMFASALGDEKAREMIEAECRRLSLDFERVSPSSARMLLDELAKTAGIVGIAARFAMARLALRCAQSWYSQRATLTRGESSRRTARASHGCSATGAERLGPIA